MDMAGYMKAMAGGKKSKEGWICVYDVQEVEEDTGRQVQVRKTLPYLPSRSC